MFCSAGAPSKLIETLRNSIAGGCPGFISGSPSINTVFRLTSRFHSRRRQLPRLSSDGSATDRAKCPAAQRPAIDCRRCVSLLARLDSSPPIRVEPLRAADGTARQDSCAQSSERKPWRATPPPLAAVLTTGLIAHAAVAAPFPSATTPLPRSYSPR